MELNEKVLRTIHEGVYGLPGLSKTISGMKVKCVIQMANCQITKRERGDMKRIGLLVVALVLGFVSFVNGEQVSKEYLRAQGLVDSGTHVVKQFEIDPDLVWFREKVKDAKALFVVPQNLKGGFFVGGSGGSGLLIARDEITGKWGYPVFHTMGAISLGVQFGAESSQIILMVMTDRGMRKMLSTTVKLGVDVTMATGPVGLGAKAVTADILSYARSKGAFAGISMEGVVIKTRDSWNHAYYNKRIAPVDVVLLHSVNNPEADKFIQAVTQLTAPPLRQP